MYPKLATIVLCALVAGALPARAELRPGGLVWIDEGGIVLRFTRNAFDVSLPVVNRGAATRAGVRVELLDERDAVIASGARTEMLGAGPRGIRMRAPTADHILRSTAPQTLALYRLRYRVDAGAGRAAEGIVAVSRAATDLFALDLITPEQANAGSRMTVRAVARGLMSGMPVRGVRLEASFDVDDDDLPDVTRLAITGADGAAMFAHDVPAEAESVDVTIVGTLGGFETEESAYVTVEPGARVLLTTDKRLYQPGQTLHVRALAFDGARRALAGEALTITAEDPDGDDVFEVEVATNRFGVASADWKIAEDTPLGDYTLRVAVDGDYLDSSTAVRISRYELPAFSVLATADLPYYLPGQSARIEVRADYLFGKPVSRGRARLVNERERRWDFDQQKWVTDEGAAFEGELDAEGRFVAVVDLSAEHATLATDDYQRFRDLAFAAYVTYATTGRTEQRRLAVRLTRQEIHLYVTQDHYGASSGLPTRFYVVASYADGRPAVCDVSFRTKHGRQLAAARTNVFGVARITESEVPAGTIRSGTLELEARDAGGRRGRHVESLWYLPAAEARVDTDRAIYRPGEPVRVRVHSTQREGVVYLDVARGSESLHSTSARLENGVASFRVPYRPDFRGEITVAAIVFGASGEDELVDTRGVVYPDRSELEVGIHPSRDEYRPGDEAEVALSIRAPGAGGVEGVLGVTVLDKAIEERERTELDFGGRGFRHAYWSLWYRDEPIAGISRADLPQLDLRRVPRAEIDLVAEVLLRNSRYDVEIDRGGRPWDEPSHVFGPMLAKGVASVRRALDERYLADGTYPCDDASLAALLAPAGIDPAALLDPWGMPLRAEFQSSVSHDLLAWKSAGPDERFDTPDDVAVEGPSRMRFYVAGSKVDTALATYHARTGRYVRDEASLRAALELAGLDPASLRDWWGRPLRLQFTVEGPEYVVHFWTGGADGLRDGVGDVTLWTSRVNYGGEARQHALGAIAAFAKAHGRLPQSQVELGMAGLDPAPVRDPWGRPLFAELVWSELMFGRYQAVMRDGSARAELERQKMVTAVSVRSAGADGVCGNADDFELARVASFEIHIPLRPVVATAKAQPSQASATTVEGGGAIRGVVTDPAGAVVSGARVTATHVIAGAVYETTTDSDGRYLLKGLPAGPYSMRFEATGFQATGVEQVLVASMTLLALDVRLEVAAASETVDVAAVADLVQSSELRASGLALLAPGLAKDGDENDRKGVRIAVDARLSTPRLREYFPETLVWEPSIETDARGQARLRFPLADSITTWKLNVVASTVDGRIGEASREILAFQPFFAELDPPKALTVGDEIALPVLLRSYLDQPQTVELSMASAQWFELLSAPSVRAEVAPGEPHPSVFRFRAVAPVAAGPQRVTAVGARASDAVEMPVLVRPDGRELAVTDGSLLDGGTTLELRLPPAPIDGSVRGQVKVYPNAMSHVVEGIEGIVQRPYGCGEQTISSTYPSLLVLRAYGDEGGPLAARARAFLEAGYERLLRYREPGGGFSYWGKGGPDEALTAYAVKFLADASTIVEIDPKVLASARKWLVSQQRADGSWSGTQVTGYVLRALVEAERSNPEPAPGVAAGAVRRALDHLDAASAADPYSLTSHALAALELGDRARAAAAITKLEALASAEGAPWRAGGATPFYGWGRTADIEVTALAARVLLRSGGGSSALARRALFYLLQSKDRHGVWYSTQTTVTVIDALLAARAATGQGAEAEIFVNGALAGAVRLGGAVSAPSAVDVSSMLVPGSNRVEVRAPGAAGIVAAQAVATCSVPWDAAEATAAPATAPRLEVRYDKTEPSIGETVRCRVIASRPLGGGMLIAEIGLPPGAEVDRESLEEALHSDRVKRYDVLPDRVVVYLWPDGPRGITFEFGFRLRYGIDAKTAPSQVYDYYNPESLRVLAPARFVVSDS